jgi:hypothetical protein
MSYNQILRLQLRFFNSLLKGLNKEKNFIQDHFKLSEVDYLGFIKKVVNIIYLQEELMKKIKMEEKIRKQSVIKQHVFLRNHIKDAFFEIYNATQSLYVWYKPYHNEDVSFLRGIRTSFTNPLYWYEKLSANLKKTK